MSYSSSTCCLLAGLSTALLSVLVGLETGDGELPLSTAAVSVGGVGEGEPPLVVAAAFSGMVAVLAAAVLSVVALSVAGGDGSTATVLLLSCVGDGGLLDDAISSSTVGTNHT